jgi:hypothetical protein
MTTLTPLNGTKTHPLSDHARNWLATIARAPVPRQDINPGVANRLLRGDLVEEVQLPSPYRSVKGNVAHLRITDAGRKEIAP